MKKRLSALLEAAFSGRLRFGLLSLALLAIAGTAFALAPTGVGVAGSAKEDPDGALALAFVKDSSTFLFDGIGESLRLESTRQMICSDCYEYTIYFESAHRGFGDRAGLDLTPHVTPHRARVFVVDHQVVMGVMDGSWDIGRQLVIEQE